MDNDFTINIKADQLMHKIHVRINLVGINATRLRIRLGALLVRLGLFIAGVDYEVTHAD